MVANSKPPEDVPILLKLTLDTNCVIDLDEGREPNASAVRFIADSAQEGKADVAVVAVTASETQLGGGHLDSFAVFRKRVAFLGLDHLKILKPLGYFDFSFWDNCVFADPAGRELERTIHDVMFPKIDFDRAAYRSNGGKDTRWRGAKCDVHVAWCHIRDDRDILVTADRDFHNNSAALIALGAKQICYPTNAATLLDGPRAKAVPKSLSCSTEDASVYS